MISSASRTRLHSWTALVALGVAFSATPVQAQLTTKVTFVEEGSFSLPEKGQPGGVDQPTAIAVAPDGALHVADGRGRVFVFTSAGAFRHVYGAGQLQRPTALAFDEVGRSYVLDKDRKRVAVFDAQGEFHHAIGSSGSRAGELREPIDMAVGPKGYVFILDKGRRGVEIFSRDGVFVRGIRFPSAMSDALALGVAPDGSVYVSDKKTARAIHRISPFPELGWVAESPAAGIRNVSLRTTGMREPVAVAVNAFGSVTILDANDRRVWMVNPDREGNPGPDDALYGGRGRSRGSFQKPVDIAFAEPDELVILDQDMRKVERVRLTTEDGLAAVPVSGFAIRLSALPSDIPNYAIHAIGTGEGGNTVVVVSDDGNRNLQLLGADIRSSEDMYGGSFNTMELNAGALQAPLPGSFREVGGVAVNATHIAATDAGRNRFNVFQRSDGSLVGQLGDDLRDVRRLRDPHGIAFTAEGNIVIADTGNDRIAVFSADWATFVGGIAFPDAYGVVLNPSGELIVWNEAGTRVARLRSDNTGFDALPASVLPSAVASVAFDGSGNAFLLDKVTSRVSILNPAMDVVLARVGREAAVSVPSRVTVDGEGNIYVTGRNVASTLVYRWDVSLAPVSGARVAYGDDDATVTWDAGSEFYVDGYRVSIQGPEGTWTHSDVTAETQAVFSGASFEGVRPVGVRIAPVGIDGSDGPATEAIALHHFAAHNRFEAEDHAGALESVDAAVLAADSGWVASDEANNTNLRLIGFASAYESGSYAVAASWGEAILAQPRESDEELTYQIRMGEIYEYLEDWPKARAATETALAGGGGAEVTEEVRESLLWRALRLTREMEDIPGFIEFGHELEVFVAEEDRSDFFVELAEASRTNGDLPGALETVRRGLNLEAEGPPLSAPQAGAVPLLLMGFDLLNETHDTAAALEWGVQVSSTSPEYFPVDFHRTMAEFQVHAGDPAAAGGRYLLINQLEPQFAADASFVDLAFDIYRSYWATFTEEEGRAFLLEVRDALSPSVPAANAALADSLAEYAIRDETRARLAPGFQAWEARDMDAVIDFFEPLLDSPDVDDEQRVIAMELVAISYFSFADRATAETVFRRIFEVDSEFDIETHSEAVFGLYGLELYTEEMLSFFGALTP